MMTMPLMSGVLPVCQLPATLHQQAQQLKGNPLQTHTLCPATELVSPVVELEILKTE
jgi:hypothetical protein